MLHFRRINNLAGWLVFFIALTVYTLTLEPTASFWDCGEFIACSYKLMVPHAPGAPLFLLLGRMFSLFARDVTQVAWWVNFLSGLCSAFTVLFLFWSITLLAKKLVIREGKELNKYKLLLIMGSGVVGAMAYTFTDTAWFSAVEAEVYAMSSFFTAIVFWVMLRWEAKAGQTGADKWLILIAYLVGLSIGVHLLNLVAIPALGFIFYFRNYKFTVWGAVLAFAGSAVVLAAILWGIIPGLPSLAAGLEVFAVNVLGLPFGSGIIAFVALLALAIVYGIYYAIKYDKHVLHTSLLCLTFVLIGYSSYLIIPIRSAYNPTIDINNPEDVLSFASYLKREQYEDRPLLYGPQYNAQPIGQQEGAPRYVKGDGRYVAAGNKVEAVYDNRDKTLLPRIYSDKPEDIRGYKYWVDLQEGQMPAFGQNLRFLFRYQLGHMYWRYFLWNFVGRESDVQHAGVLWFDGLGINVPESIKANKARNCFYLLPLLLGILGLIYQVRKKKQDAFVIGLLFFFTGIAIALYLNQPPTEPRERDYAFAGSFYAFSIWIGLGVLGMAELLSKVIRYRTIVAMLAFILCLPVPGIMALAGWDDHDRSDRNFSVDSAKNLLDSCAPNAILLTNGDNDTYPLWYAQEVEGYRTDVRIAVMTFLNTEWYIDQMQRPAYEAKPWPLSLGHENYKLGTNDYMPYLERPQVAAGIDLKQFIQLVKENHPALQAQYGEGETLLTFPTKNFFLDVKAEEVRQKGFIPQAKQDQIAGSLHLAVDKSYLEKRHLVLLDLLSTNNWERPIYFSGGIARADYLGLDNYSQLEGMAYRIVPVKTVDAQEQGYVNREAMYRNLMQTFSYRSLDTPGTYLDQNYLRFTASTREKFVLLAESYLKDGNKQRAKEVADFCLEKMPPATVPYDYYAPGLIPILTKVGERQRAEAMLEKMATATQQELDYYFAKGPLFEREIQLRMLQLQELVVAAQDSGMQDKTRQLQQPFGLYLQRMQQQVP